MSNKFDPPTVEEKVSTVDKKVTVRDNARIVEEDKTTETVPVKRDISDIYIEEIKKFTKHISGETIYPTLAEREQAQLGFITTFNNIFMADYQYLDKALTFFVKEINSNPLAYVDDNVLAPAQSLMKKKKVNNEIYNRYKTSLTFLIMYAKNIRNKELFLSVFDVPTFLNMWPSPYKDRINSFIYK